ncbi:MAG: protein-disulfide reductase DsbD domain-containing protein [Sulfitobacter sp.]
MMRILFCTAALIATSTAAIAADPMAPPATATLIEGWQQADGTRVSAVQITMAEGWHTYWRAPGDAGIPPQFKWNGSRNLNAVSVNWPTPELFSQNGMRSVGYSNQVILPLSVSAKRHNKPVHLKLNLEIGVCKDICVPQTLTLDGVLNNQNAIPTPAIAAALAERPFTAAEAGARGATCSMSPSEDGLNITAHLNVPPTGSSEFVVIEAGRPDVWVSEAAVSRNGNMLTAQAEIIPNGTGAFAVDRSALRFTVMGASHAVDIRGCAPS